MHADRLARRARARAAADRLGHPHGREHRPARPAGLQEAYPAVEIALSDPGGTDAAAQLPTGELEVAVVALHEHQLPPGIAYHLLRLVPLMAVASRRQRLRGAGVTDLGKPADEPFLACVPPDAGLRAQVDAAFCRARAHRRSVCSRRSAGDLAS